MFRLRAADVTMTNHPTSFDAFLLSDSQDLTEFVSRSRYYINPNSQSVNEIFTQPFIFNELPLQDSHPNEKQGVLSLDFDLLDNQIEDRILELDENFKEIQISSFLEQKQVHNASTQQLSTLSGNSTPASPNSCFSTGTYFDPPSSSKYPFVNKSSQHIQSPTSYGNDSRINHIPNTATGPVEIIGSPQIQSNQNYHKYENVNPNGNNPSQVSQQQTAQQIAQDAQQIAQQTEQLPPQQDAQQIAQQTAQDAQQIAQQTEQLPPQQDAQQIARQANIYTSGTHRIPTQASSALHQNLGMNILYDEDEENKMRIEALPEQVPLSITKMSNEVPLVNFQSFHSSQQILLLLIALLRLRYKTRNQPLEVPNSIWERIELVRKEEGKGIFPKGLYSNLITLIDACTQSVSSFWTLRLHTLHLSKSKQVYTYPSDNNYHDTLKWCFLNQSYFIFDTQDGLPSLKDYTKIYYMLKGENASNPQFSEVIKRDIEELFKIDTQNILQGELFRYFRDAPSQNWTEDLFQLSALEPYARYSDILWNDNGKLISSPSYMSPTLLPALPVIPLESWSLLIPRHSKSAIFYIAIRNILLSERNVENAPFIGYVAFAAEGVDSYFQNRPLKEILQHFQYCGLTNNFVPYSLEVTQEFILDLFLLLTWLRDPANFSNPHIPSERLNCCLYLLWSKTYSSRLYKVERAPMDVVAFANQKVYQLIQDNNLSDFVHGINVIEDALLPANVNETFNMNSETETVHENSRFKTVSEIIKQNNLNVYSILPEKDLVNLLSKKSNENSAIYVELYIHYCKKHTCKPNSDILIAMHHGSFCNKNGVVDLSRNFVGDRGIKPILDCIVYMNACKTFCARYCHISNESLTYMLEQMKKNSSITSIDLRGNEDLGLSAGFQLLQFVSECEWICEILLEKTCIPLKVIRDIQNILWNRLQKNSIP